MNYANQQSISLDIYDQLTDNKPGIAELLFHILKPRLLVVLQLFKLRRLVDQVLDFGFHLGDEQASKGEFFFNLYNRCFRFMSKVR
jgi:hypothetical protein